MIQLNARYRSRCAQCGRFIGIGERIVYEPTTQMTRHVGCLPSANRPIVHVPLMAEREGGWPQPGETFRSRDHGLVTVLDVHVEPADPALRTADGGPWLVMLECRPAPTRRSELRRRRDFADD
jgi:hypothetical protein